MGRRTRRLSVFKSLWMIIGLREWRYAMPRAQSTGYKMRRLRSAGGMDALPIPSCRVKPQSIVIDWSIRMLARLPRARYSVMIQGVTGSVQAPINKRIFGCLNLLREK